MNLDSSKDIQKYDKENVLGSIDALDQQVEHAWKDTRSLEFSLETEVRNVLVAGMGGSGLGADIIKTVFKDSLNVPFDFIHNYDLPAYVDQHTLVILASYSGNTEEIISVAQQTLDKKAQVGVITAGGKLQQLAEDNDWTTYLIDPKFNPSDQPRMALGYAVFGAVALLSAAGVVTLSKKEKDQVVSTIKRVKDEQGQAAPKADNLAKQLAQQIHGKRPIYVTSDHLEGALHAATNQANESAKIFADYKVVPEINHHLMEGLRFPASNSETHLFIFIQSELFHPRNQARMELTAEVVEKNGIPTTQVKLSAPTKLTQAFEALTIFAYVGFYISMLEEINPAPVPYVDWFKDELKKRFA